MKNYTSSQYVQGKQITYSDNESKQLIKDAKQVTHEQLKQIRDKSTLIPGQWYRITDYVCTTTQESTQSAGHPFDILVRADAADKLNETAYATLHKGDTYFANSKLEAWELKYTIDNDTTRFAWADSENGKGVIYYMKDEWNNECPYDFKNIQYVFTQGFTVTYQTFGTRTKVYGRNETNDQTIDGTTYYSWIKVAEPSSGGADMPDEYWTTTLTLSTSMDRYTISNGVATKYTQGSIISTVSEDFDTFTFDSQGTDASLNVSSKTVYSNVILRYIVSYKIALNRIFARADYTLVYYNNMFGNSCYDNTFGNYCYNNMFGDGCHNITFGGSCFHNTFGNSCSGNTFGDNCNGNTFGDSCSGNTFGNNCSGNTFGNNCNGNTFGDKCSYNTFGNSCSYNTFGSGTQSPQSYFESIIFENGNRNINLTCSQTTSSSNKCRNVLVALGVNNTTTAKTITIDAVNQNYKTVVCTDSLGQIVTYIPGDAHAPQIIDDVNPEL